MTDTVYTNSQPRLSQGHQRIVFRNPRGLKYYYALYFSSTGFYIAYSSDGTDWVSTTQIANYDINFQSFDVKIQDNGSLLKVRIIWHEGNTLNYRYGTIADDSGGITLYSERIIRTGIISPLPGYHCCAIARTYNGNLVVGYSSDATIHNKSYRGVLLWGSSGDGQNPTWVDQESIFSGTSENNNQNKDQVWFSMEGEDSDNPDRILYAGRFPNGDTNTAYDCLTDEIDWNGSVWGDESPTTLLSIDDDHGLYVSALIDDSNYYHCLVWDGANARLDHFKSASVGADDWGSANTVSTSAVDACTLTLDTGPATDLLYAFYHDSADTQDFNYKTSPVDTISWSSEGIVSYHEDIIVLSSWNRAVENSLHIAGVHGTAVIYNEHPVYKTLSTTLADLEFPDQNYYLGPHST